MLPNDQSASQNTAITYAQQGYHLAAHAFTATELETLIAEVEGRVGRYRSDATVIEVGRKSVRSVYGGLESSALLQRLVRDERLVGLAQQMLGDDVYVYQFKVNTKAPFVGDQWPWHQDYAFWAQLDEMPTPNAVSVTLYLDEVNEFNGPMYYVPGSHRAGLYACETSDDIGIDAAEATKRGSDVSSKLRFTMRRDVVTALVADRGLQSARASRGSAFFFHPNLPHASGINISPYMRRQIFITYNAVGNIPVQPPARAAYLVSRDTSPLAAAHPSALLGC